MGHRRDEDAEAREARTPVGTRITCSAAALVLLAAAALLGLVARNEGRAAYAEAVAKVRLADVSEAAGMLAAAIDLYLEDTGALPDALADLCAESGPDGYRGPYIAVLPMNPVSGAADWTYDPRTGVVTDPTGTWTGSAKPSQGAISGSAVDAGRMPPIRAEDVVTGETLDLASLKGRTTRVWIYFFSTDDDSCQDDLRALSDARERDVSIVGVLVDKTMRRARSRANRVEALHLGFPVIDATTQLPDLEAPLSLYETPALYICDRELGRRARVSGGVEIDRIHEAEEEALRFEDLVNLRAPE